MNKKEFLFVLLLGFVLQIALRLAEVEHPVLIAFVVAIVSSPLVLWRKR